jgi:hypothetical protein
VRTVRRECLDQCLIFGERQLFRILREYVAFYNAHRPHQGIGQMTPIPQNCKNHKSGEIVSVPVLGGLQHYYERKSA